MAPITQKPAARSKAAAGPPQASAQAKTKTRAHAHGIINAKAKSGPRVQARLQLPGLEPEIPMPRSQRS